MLAGPPPSFNAGTMPSTMRQPTSEMYSNQFQPPVLPPNYQPNQHQSHAQPPMMNNGISTFSTNFHLKYTTIHIF
jgi:hypothetical protein